MPITYRVDSQHRLIEVTHRGEVTLADVQESNARMRQDPAIQPDFRILIITTEGQPRFTAEEWMLHRESRKQFPKRPQIAIVAPTDYLFGLSRMYEIATDSVAAEQIKVFRSLPEARQWLGIPE